jgi:hypothetical protein
MPARIRDIGLFYRPTIRTLKLSFVVQVPHVKQAYAWDCGLACVLMVLRALGMGGVNLKTLRQMCPIMRYAPHLS